MAELRDLPAWWRLLDEKRRAEFKEF